MVMLHPWTKMLPSTLRPQSTFQSSGPTCCPQPQSINWQCFLSVDQLQASADDQVYFIAVAEKMFCKLQGSLCQIMFVLAYFSACACMFWFLYWIGIKLHFLHDACINSIIWLIPTPVQSISLLNLTLNFILCNFFSSYMYMLHAHSMQSVILIFI